MHSIPRLGKISYMLPVIENMPPAGIQINVGINLVKVEIPPEVVSDPDLSDLYDQVCAVLHHVMVYINCSALMH